MANVKITELTELAAVDLAENDVLPIVDVGSDATKKVTIVSLRDHASANDFITYTLLNANVKYSTRQCRLLTLLILTQYKTM